MEGYLYYMIAGAVVGTLCGVMVWFKVEQKYKMRDALKLLFFSAYFLLVPLCAYYWNNHAWEERIARERGRIIEAQLKMIVSMGGGVLPIPDGIYLVGEGYDNTILRRVP